MLRKELSVIISNSHLKPIEDFLYELILKKCKYSSLTKIAVYEIFKTQWESMLTGEMGAFMVQLRPQPLTAP